MNVRIKFQNNLAQTANLFVNGKDSNVSTDIHLYYYASKNVKWGVNASISQWNSGKINKDDIFLIQVICFVQMLSLFRIHAWKLLANGNYYNWLQTSLLQPRRAVVRQEQNAVRVVPLGCYFSSLNFVLACISCEELNSGSNLLLPNFMGK